MHPKTQLPMGITPAPLPHTDTSANRQQPTMRSKETRKRIHTWITQEPLRLLPHPQHRTGSPKPHNKPLHTDSCIRGCPSRLWRYHRLPPLHSSSHGLLPDNTLAWPCRVSCSATLCFRVHTVAPPYSRNQAPCALTHSSSRLVQPGGTLSPTSQDPHLDAPSEYAWAALHSHQKP